LQSKDRLLAFFLIHALEIHHPRRDGEQGQPLVPLAELEARVSVKHQRFRFLLSLSARKQ